MDTHRDRWNSQAGYNLVVMVIVITFFNVIVASAWPLWSAFAKREREEQLIFRGLQYAEAIRVFQIRFGRYPNRIEELVELEPRCIRQLWDDPMSEDGKWGLIRGNAARKAAAPAVSSPMADIIKERREAAAKEGNGDNPQPAPPSPTPGPGQPGGGEEMVAGPIVGVYSRSTESGFQTFFGQSSYGQWRFTADLVSQQPMGPTGVRTPHIGPRTLGKPFRGNISAPGAGGPGEPPTGARAPDRDGKGQPSPSDMPAGPG